MAVHISPWLPDTRRAPGVCVRWVILEEIVGIQSWAKSIWSVNNTYKTTSGKELWVDWWLSHWFPLYSLFIFIFALARARVCKYADTSAGSVISSKRLLIYYQVLHNIKFFACSWRNFRSGFIILEGLVLSVGLWSVRIRNAEKTNFFS